MDDRFLENALRQREWDDCYKYDYCSYGMSIGEDDEDDEDEDEGDV